MSSLVLYHVDLTALQATDRAQAAEYAARADALLQDAALRGRVAIIVVHTCERYEVYAGWGEARVGQLLRQAGMSRVSRVAETAGAFRHLVRVASGLESRIPGEPHILGQVRAALTRALELRTSSPSLARTFDDAIRCARHVRRRSEAGLRGDGYAPRAVAALAAAIGAVGKAHAVVVGCGALGREVALGLRSAGVGRLTIVGRHEDRTASLARELQAEWLTLDAFCTRGPACDAIVTAVSSSAPIISADTLGRCAPRVVIDLGGAPNVEGDPGQEAACPIFRLEDLGGAQATRAFAEASVLVDREIARYLSRADSVRFDSHNRGLELAS